MIRFEDIEQNLDELRSRFDSASPFPHVVIDQFADENILRVACATIPSPVEDGSGKSRDYFFAKNKFEKADFRGLHPAFEDLYRDLTGNRFAGILRRITGENVFVDPAFHGGGLHQGGVDSFLDMHVDFNFHPMHSSWFRNLNILLYLNQDWRQEYGGELKLRHRVSGEHARIAPVFNRCVIMPTRDFTLHGYDRIAFPKGSYRRSVAAYAYTELSEQDSAGVDRRSTLWLPESGSRVKKLIGRWWPSLVRWKGAVFGSGTARNK